MSNLPDGIFDPGNPDIYGEEIPYPEPDDQHDGSTITELEQLVKHVQKMTPFEHYQDFCVRHWNCIPASAETYEKHVTKLVGGGFSL